MHALVPRHELELGPRQHPVAVQARQSDGANGDFDDLYDGVIVRDVLDGSHHGDVFIAFDPEQIKAVDNCGLFDPESAALRDKPEAPRDG